MLDGGLLVLFFSTDAHVLTGDDPVLGRGLPDPPQPGELAANTALGPLTGNEVVLLHTPCGFNDDMYETGFACAYCLPTVYAFPL